MVELSVWTMVGPTEERERVKDAVRNVFPATELEGDSRLEGKLTVHDLETFKHVVKKRQILPTVRSQLFRNQKGVKSTLFLHKQAAYAGKFSLVGKYEQSTLGAVVLEISDFEEFLDWLSSDSPNQ